MKRRNGGRQKIKRKIGNKRKVGDGKEFSET
jgi:hypothetical protein